jgi:hypothetical protein
VLSPTSLDRVDEDGDWVRREIETAVHEGRNVIPVFVDGFKFSAVKSYLTGGLEKLPSFNGMDLPLAFFEAAIDKLDGFLNRNITVATNAATAQAAAAAAADLKALAGFAKQFPLAPELAHTPVSFTHKHIKDLESLDHRFRHLHEIATTSIEPPTAWLARRLAGLFTIEDDQGKVLVKQILIQVPKSADGHFCRAVFAEIDGNFEAAYIEFKNHQWLKGGRMTPSEMASVFERRVEISKGTHSSEPLPSDFASDRKSLVLFSVLMIISIILLASLPWVRSYVADMFMIKAH